jgi:hypothetical protein
MKARCRGRFYPKHVMRRSRSAEAHLFGRARADRAAGLHLSLQAGDVEQIGKLFESVLARETGQIGRQFRNVAGGVARAGLSGQIGAHVLAAASLASVA